jgi:hypothetical protein
MFETASQLHVWFALAWGFGMLIPVLARWPEGPSMAASLFALNAAGLARVYLLAAAAAGVTLAAVHYLLSIQ